MTTPKAECVIEGCERIVRNKLHGWCEAHYRAWYRWGDPLTNKAPRHGDRRPNGSEKASPEYDAWRAMKARCYQASHVSYHNYGARGIVVSTRWLLSYVNFLADMGRKPSPEHSLDRIDNNGRYSPENCKWSTRKEQAKNSRHAERTRSPVTGRFQS